MKIRSIWVGLISACMLLSTAYAEGLANIVLPPPQWLADRIDFYQTPEGSPYAQAVFQTLYQGRTAYYFESENASDVVAKYPANMLFDEQGFLLCRFTGKLKDARQKCPSFLDDPIAMIRVWSRSND